MKPHVFGPHGPSSKGEGHPVMFGFKPALDFGPFPDGGGYPTTFLKHAYATLECPDPDLVLHLFSGSMRRGLRIDIRHEMRPSIVADARALPFADESQMWIMADPPYSREYARNLYGTEQVYPTPGSVLKEASRVLMPGGRLGFLHFQVPMSRKPLKLVSVWGITTGAGYAIRAWSVFEKMS
jgi:hypothetical protein